MYLTEDDSPRSITFAASARQKGLDSANLQKHIFNRRYMILGRNFQRSMCES